MESKNQNSRSHSRSPDLIQQIAHLYMNFIRWVCFIPGGLMVGGLIVFAGLVGFWLFGIMLEFFYPNVAGKPPFFLSLILVIYLSILPVAFGFSTTAYGAHIAPSENKKIPGLIMTFLLALLFFSRLPERFLDPPEVLAIIFSVLSVLTSLITAFRLKPVKGAEFLGGIEYNKSI
jgi:hypothetical protein